MDEAAFERELHAIRSEFPKATHHCWAWRIGEAYRFSDDGEPGGTAGRPIQQVIDGSGLRDFGIVVVRWFGGTKLGSGGLIRAYTASAQDALARATVCEIVPLISCPVRIPFDALGLRDELESLFPQAEVIGGRFTEDGWSGTLRLPASDSEALRAFLRERLR